MTTEIPWLLVHGALVWKLVAVVVAALWCVELRRSIRYRATMTRRWASGFFARGATVDPHGNASLEGVLERVDGDVTDFGGGAAAAVTAVRSERIPDSLADACDRAACARASKVGLRRDDGSLVELDGPILLLAAQTERWSHTRVLKRDAKVAARVAAADAAGAAMLEGERVVIASARWGERVRAYGRVESVQLMREHPRVVLCVPVSSESGSALPMPAIVMCSVKPTDVVGPSARAYGLAALGALCAALAGQTLLGELAILQIRGAATRSGSLYDGPSGFQVPSWSWATLAACTPLRRATALNFVPQAMTRAPRDRREVRLLAGLVSLSDRCERAVAILARHGQTAEALELGARCDTPASRFQAAEIAHNAGQFDLASVLIDRNRENTAEFDSQWLFAVVTHLLAKQPSRAVFAAHQAVESLKRHGRTGEAQEVECVAWALEARAGSSRSAGALATRASTRESDRCALLHADLLQGEERLQFMARARLLRDQTHRRDAAMYLGLEADGVTPVEGPVVRDAGAVALGRWDPLEPSLASIAASAQQRILATRRNDGAQLIVADGLSMFEAMLGDRHGARARLRAFDAGIARPRDAETDSDAHRALIEAAIDLRAGLVRDAYARLSVYPGDDAETVRALVEALHREDVGRLGTALEIPEPDESTLTSPPASVVVLGFAQRHDGAGLAGWLWRGIDQSAPLSLMAYGMFAVRGEPMTEWLRWGTRAVCWRCISRDVIAAHSSQWRMARTLGARDVEAAELQSLRRWRAALMQRSIAVPLWVVESL